MADESGGPIFRANKRRKVFRKRADSDDQTQSPAVAAVEDTGNGQRATSDHKNILDEDGQTTSIPEVSRARRPKRQGIAFSSNDPASSRSQDRNDETALVVATESNPPHQHNDRFARQTGKLVVEDDKHMSAYIDSKLAEMRSAAATPNPPSKASEPAAENAQRGRLSTSPPDSAEQPAAPHQPTPSQPQEQAPTDRTTLRRRGKKQRAASPSTQARASLIDEIMRESNHTSHYTAPSANPNISSTDQAALDPDAAAAAAFKAEFLAQAEARNLSRRQPAVNSSATAATSSGPKLGGSRAMRERMKAAEEAKGKK